jgi:hypothetical protein
MGQPIGGDVLLSVPMCKTRSVTISRDETGSFGIQVKSVGSANVLGSVRIVALKPFQRYRGLEVGDVIFEVEGEYLLASDSQAVVAAIRGCAELATFVVASPEEIDHHQHARIGSPEQAQSGQLQLQSRSVSCDHCASLPTSPTSPHVIVMPPSSADSTELDTLEAAQAEVSKRQAELTHISALLSSKIDSIGLDSAMVESNECVLPPARQHNPVSSHTSS